MFVVIVRRCVCCYDKTVCLLLWSDGAFVVIVRQCVCCYDKLVCLLL